MLVAEDAGGRPDPPLLVVLDEAANICWTADLSTLYSHLGSCGIVPVTILQSYAQGEGVWGTNASAGAVRRRLSSLGAGLDDAAFVEEVSRMVGDHAVAAVSVSSGTGRQTRTTSTRRERILSAAELRALPKGVALAAGTGQKPAMLALLPCAPGHGRDRSPLPLPLPLPQPAPRPGSPGPASLHRPPGRAASSRTWSKRSPTSAPAKHERGAEPAGETVPFRHGDVEHLVEAVWAPLYAWHLTSAWYAQ